MEPGDGIELGDRARYAITAPEPALIARLGLDQPARVLEPRAAGRAPETNFRGPDTGP